MAYLTLVLENREVRKFVLNRGVTTIGRSQENDIVINNLALSRQHAQVEYRGGAYLVQDLKSQNGVYLNGKKIFEAMPLSDSDRITLGTYQFVFKNEQSDAEKPKVRAAPKPPSQPPPAERDEEPAEEVPLLVLKYNDMELQRFPLKSGECMVGRAKECDIQIPERRLSRMHCKIVRDARGRVYLQDLESQNGTYVNRRKIQGTKDLVNGDVLNFAEYSILFLSNVADYAGPDSIHAGQKALSAPPGRNGDIAIEETVMPAAFEESDDVVRPSEGWEDPEEGNTPPPPVAVSPKQRSVPPPAPRRDPPERERREPERREPERNAWTGVAKAAERPGFVDGKRAEPIVEPPNRARDRAIRKADQDPSRPPRSAEPATDSSQIPEPRGPGRAKLEPAKRRPPSRRPPVGDVKLKPKRGGPPEKQRRHPDEVDVPDREELPEHDGDLDEWYSSRNEKSNLYEPPEKPEPDGDDDSALLQRSQSSISRVLEPMTVNKREIDHNIKAKANKRPTRRFYIDVIHEDKKVFSGPLTEQVTILGKDPESDIQLKGRYVAGRHSLFVMVRDSLLLVRLGSSSATRVNGLPKLQAFLKAGDVVQIDETTIKISED